ncbi:MAG: hypothetical protein GYB31_01170 [Bacteroidetes bacterium]|nr:hypothetical protein [Bacteroidota bacterium]
MRKFGFLTGIGFLLVLTTLLAGCYEKEEGCLDIGATNFDPSADKACEDDCCEYPRVELRVTTVFSDRTLTEPLSFALDNFYEVPGVAGDSFSITRLRYYISDLELLSGNDVFRVTDELEIEVNGSKTIITDDIGILEPGSSPGYSVGTFPYPGSYDGLRFKVGLPDPVKMGDPASVPAGHPLSILGDSTLWLEDEGYMAAYLEVFREPAAVDSILLRIPEPILFEFFPESPIVLTAGFDISLQIQNDIRLWFKGTNPKVDPVSTLEDKIQANLSGAFRFTGFN